MLLRLVLLVALGGCTVSGVSEAPGCAPTPSAAALGLTDTKSTSGYRLVSLQRDGVIGKRWAVVADCDHPTWPPLWVPVPMNAPSVMTGSPTKASNSEVLVLAGETVVLRYVSASMRMELHGVAESNGRRGERVLMRVVNPLDEDSAQAQNLLVVVQGRDEVRLRDDASE